MIVRKSNLSKGDSPAMVIRNLCTVSIFFVLTMWPSSNERLDLTLWMAFSTYPTERVRANCSHASSSTIPRKCFWILTLIYVRWAETALRSCGASLACCESIAKYDLWIIISYRSIVITVCSHLHCESSFWTLPWRPTCYSGLRQAVFWHIYAAEFTTYDSLESSVMLIEWGAGSTIIIPKYYETFILSAKAVVRFWTHQPQR